MHSLFLFLSIQGELANITGKLPKTFQSNADFFEQTFQDEKDSNDDNSNGSLLVRSLYQPPCNHDPNPNFVILFLYTNVKNLIRYTQITVNSNYIPTRRTPIMLFNLTTQNFQLL